MHAIKSSERFRVVLRSCRINSSTFSLKNLPHFEQVQLFSKQLRSDLRNYVFLPSRCFKIVRAHTNQSEKVVRFHVPMTYSKFDIKNYLEQIYNVKVAKISVDIRTGNKYRVISENSNRIVKLKRPDIKVAHVLLKEGKFEFPDLSQALISREEIEKEFSGGANQDIDSEATQSLDKEDNKLFKKLEKERESKQTVA